MTPTEVARRSDALYFDCDHTHRRWLCDRIAHLEADMEEMAERGWRGSAAPTITVDSEGLVGSCRCGSCGEAIDPWDSYCRHCGAGVAAERKVGRS